MRPVEMSANRKPGCLHTPTCSYALNSQDAADTLAENETWLRIAADKQGVDHSHQHTHTHTHTHNQGLGFIVQESLQLVRLASKEVVFYKDI